MHLGMAVLLSYITHIVLAGYMGSLCNYTCCIINDPPAEHNIKNKGALKVITAV